MNQIIRMAKHWTQGCSSSPVHTLSTWSVHGTFQTYGQYDECLSGGKDGFIISLEPIYSDHHHRTKPGFPFRNYHFRHRNLCRVNWPWYSTAMLVPSLTWWSYALWPRVSTAGGQPISSNHAHSGTATLKPTWLGSVLCTLWLLKILTLKLNSSVPNFALANLV